jgi:tripartite-type tricarboxylate transporter receptor subunit TctC
MKFAMISRRRVLASALAVAAVSTAGAQEPYPSRVIKLIVPVPPGGPADVLGRLVAQSMTANLGQQVVVENRAGAGSTLAGKSVATAEPDGYTLLLGGAAALAIGPALYKSAGYDPVTSFSPISNFATVPYVMIVSPTLPVKTVPELLAYAKSHPHKLAFGAANAAPPYMLIALFKARTNADILLVPYKGAAGVMTDLVGGQIHGGFETTSVLYGHLREGTVRALAVAQPQRLPDLPDIPTMAESGVPDFVASSWQGVVAPAGTPKEIVTRLNRAIVDGLKNPILLQRLKQLGAIPQPETPENFGAFIDAENRKWSAMATLTGAHSGD